MDCRLTYVGHATVLVETDGLRLLTDPMLRARLGPLRRHGARPAADLTDGIDAVLLSHLHHDHADLPSLRRLDSSTPVFVPPGAGGFLRRRGFRTVTELRPGESTEMGEVRITAVDAEHSGGRRIASRATEAVGFRIAGRQSIYFAGDTDLFDGMEELGELDAALLPVWGWGPSIGPGHLDPERAARAAAILRPRVAVPIHWGTLFPIGLDRFSPERLTAPPRDFSQWVARLAPQVEVRVLAPGESTSLE
jgi:L-ascorbate metabolism protein UlaG (beta-lactamase superfamily)